MKCFVAFVAVAFLATSCAGAAAPVDYANVNLGDYFELCDRADPQRDECFRRSFQYILQQMNKGEQNLALPPFDPLAFKNLRFTFDSPILLLSSLLIKNAKVTGFGKTKIKSVKTEFKNDEMRAVIDVEIPKLFVEGNYKGEGRYTNIRYGPKGYFNVTTGDISASIKVAGRTEERDGETYMILRKFDFQPEIGKLRVGVNGLFPDEGLNQVAVELINNNWQPMYKVILESAKQIWEPLLIQQVNSVFSVIPYRNMFL